MVTPSSSRTPRPTQRSSDLTEAVQPKSLHLPLYHDGGAVAALFDADTAITSVDITRA
jgi:hypothetical protein